jgi:hypothetical protein
VSDCATNFSSGIRVATITLARGEPSYQCWCYLTSNHYSFVSYRVYSLEPELDSGLLAFDIDDSAVAVEMALRYA